MAPTASDGPGQSSKGVWAVCQQSTISPALVATSKWASSVDQPACQPLISDVSRSLAVCIAKKASVKHAAEAYSFTNLCMLSTAVQAYSLGGMGCGAGVIGIHLVRDVLQAHPGANALYITSEICSSAFYEGKDQRCLVSCFSLLAKASLGPWPYLWVGAQGGAYFWR